MSTAAVRPDRPIDYPEFRDQLFARHEAPLAAALSTAGDILVVAGPVLGLLTRRWQVGAAGLAAGAALMTTAHLFQPGSLRPELAAIVGHPVWATRAELERVARRRR